ncbi:MAG: hypothetical protein JW888_03085 [Pirellulales bacterium]|nr:hypothetical protein [Pirellulales bacterium]
MKKLIRFPVPSLALDVRIASNRCEWTGAFELVYRCYLAKNYIPPHPGRIVYQPVFGLPVSRTIIATSELDEVLGTLTVVGDNASGMQLEATYPFEVQSLRSDGRKVAEITCLAVWPTHEFHPRAVFFAITRFMFHYTRWAGYDDLLMAIHPSHQKFYQYCLGAESLGPLRPNKAVRGNPSVCCRIDLHKLRSRVNPKLLQQYETGEQPESRFKAPKIPQADHLHFCRLRGISPEGDFLAGKAERHRALGRDAA